MTTIEQSIDNLITALFENYEKNDDSVNYEECIQDTIKQFDPQSTSKKLVIEDICEMCDLYLDCYISEEYDNLLEKSKTLDEYKNINDKNEATETAISIAIGDKLSQIFTLGHEINNDKFNNIIINIFNSYCEKNNIKYE